MRFENEVQELYLNAYGKGISSLRKTEKEGAPMHLQVLEATLDKTRVAYKTDLGVMEIPVSQIVGVLAANGKQQLYTPDFLPLSSPKSAFAQQWCQVYLEYLSDKGLRAPICCYEYLGRFYVQDGVKRVSVLKADGASTVSAQVIRLMPKYTKEQNVQRYYEFLHHFRLTRLYQVFFTRPGSFEKLQAALGHESNHRWDETDRFGFLFHWCTIENAFLKAYGHELTITAADALIVLLEHYTYAQIIKMPVWLLTRVFQAYWKELYALSFPGYAPEAKQHFTGKLQTA